MFNQKAITTVALAAFASAAGVAASVGEASAQMQTPFNGAPEFRDGEQRFKMRGRFQYDVLTSDFDVGSDDGTRSYVRRAFLGAQGRFSPNWRYKIDFVLNPGASDVATTNLCRDTTTNVVTATTSSCPTGTVLISAVATGGGGDDVAVDDAYLEYAGDFFSFVIGEHNVTVPLEDRTSSLDTPFNERSALINAFGFGRSAGVGLVTTGANWSAAVALQGDSLNNQDPNFANDELVQYSGRFTWAPFYENSPEGYSLIHLGLSARYRYFGDDATFRYRSRPFLGRGARPLDSGSGATGERDTTIGLEAAFQHNGFGATIEYASLDGSTAGATETDFNHDAWYVDVFWSPTGEARNYRGNTGSFGAIAPRRSVVEGGPGHWMLGARYESLDLSDPVTTSAGANLASSSTRGEQTGWGVGLDWVPVDHVKFKLNYAQSEFDFVNPASIDESAQLISLRAQFDF